VLDYFLEARHVNPTGFKSKTAIFSGEGTAGDEHRAVIRHRRAWIGPFPLLSGKDEVEVTHEYPTLREIFFYLPQLLQEKLLVDIILGGGGIDPSYCPNITIYPQSW
jgi:hypothetical protein